MQTLYYVDAHTHLTDEAFDLDRDEVVLRALQAPLKYCNLVGIDLATSQASLALADRYPGFFDVSCGLHPQMIQDYSPEEKEAVLSLCQDDRVVCIGEIGLDYRWYPEQKDLQKEAFVQQIELANQLKKPIMIHCREAIQDTYDLLKNHRPHYGCIMHSFSGSLEMAQQFIKLGCLISLGGVTTFKNAHKPKEVAKAIPLTSLLTETDSPYLTPTPFRGKRNESSYVVYVAKEIAGLRGIDVSEVCNQVILNYERIFNKEAQ